MTDILENQYSRGTDKYPTGITSTLNAIDYYVKKVLTFNPCNHHMRKDEEDNEDLEMTFV